MSQLLVSRLQDTRLVSIVDQAVDNKVRVPLGRSDSVEEGDIFSIYSKEYCNVHLRQPGTPLAIARARVVEIDDSHSIIEVDRDEYDLIPECRNRYHAFLFQVGDYVERVNNIIESDSERQTDSSNPRVLFRYPFFLAELFIPKKMIIVKNINDHVDAYLEEASSRFNIQVFIDYR